MKKHQQISESYMRVLKNSHILKREHNIQKNHTYIVTKTGTIQNVTLFRITKNYFPRPQF